MGIYDVFLIFGGLGLFIYGMQMLGEGLEKAAGDKLKIVIEKLTSNKLIGFVVGCVVTILVQSSSATTVMAVGFVNAGIMSLAQSVGIILGANVGTTITAQLIAFKLTDIAPVFAFIGLIMMMIFNKKKDKMYYLGYVILGFGILFIGMNMMGDSLKPLSDSVVFRDMMTSFSNPILGILIGLFVTVIVQSSSVSIGLLQALALAGLVTMDNSIYLLLGMNIGTCVTALIASFGCSVNAKRTAVIHILQKVMATILFMVLMLFIPFISIVEGISPGDTTRQIANVHTMFNIIGVIFLLPISSVTVKLATMIVPEKAIKEDNAIKFMHVDKNMMSTPTIAQAQLIKEVTRLGEMALDNIILSKDIFLDSKSELIPLLNENEDRIDKYTDKITAYMMELQSKATLTHDEEIDMGLIYHAIIDMERIGDYSQNVAEYYEQLVSKNMQFSEEAIAEIKEIFENVENTIVLSLKAFKQRSLEYAKETAISEDRVDELIAQGIDNHINRMSMHLCGPIKGVVFTNLLNDLERVSDHAQNIAYCVRSTGKKAAGFLMNEEGK